MQLEEFKRKRKAQEVYKLSLMMINCHPCVSEHSSSRHTTRWLTIGSSSGPDGCRLVVKSDRGWPAPPPGRAPPRPAGSPGSGGCRCWSDRRAAWLGRGGPAAGPSGNAAQSSDDSPASFSVKLCWDKTIDSPVSLLIILKLLEKAPKKHRHPTVEWWTRFKMTQIQPKSLSDNSRQTVWSTGPVLLFIGATFTW